MRLFLAVVPPPGAQALAAGVTDALRSPGDGVSWVRRENLHYTLRFIGEVDEAGAERVAAAAREAASGQSRFEAVLGSPSAFPDARRARVIWLGLSHGNEPFAQLAHALASALAKRGFAHEDRGFTAHLTLGRVREPGRDWSAEVAGAATPQGPAARFGVEAIEVVESRLSPRGAIYAVRARAGLGPGPGQNGP